MARLPTVADMGARPSSRSPRGIAPVRGGIAEDAAARGFREEGAAVAGAGKEVARAGFLLADEDARREAMQLDTEYADGVRLLQYGDGSKENPGYFALKGQAAIDGREAYIKGLESLQEKTLAKATNDLARGRVGPSLEVRRKSALNRGLSHFGAQREAANIAAFVAHQATLADDAAVQGEAGDTEGLLKTAEKAGMAAALHAKQTGADPEHAAEAAVSGIIISEIKRRALASPHSARSFFEEHKGDIDGRQHYAIEVLLKRAERENSAGMGRAVQDHLASIRATGKGLSGVVDRARATMKPEAFSDFLSDVGLAHDFHETAEAVRFAPPGEAAEALERFRPEGGKEGFARRQQNFEALQSYTLNLMRQRQDDPAGYVSQMPSVKSEQDVLPRIKASLSAQEALGIPAVARRVLSKGQAQQIVSELRGMSGEERAAQLLQIRETYGEFYLAALRDMADKKFNGVGMDSRNAVLASVVGNPALSQAVGKVIDVDRKELRAGLDQTVVNDVFKNVDAALRPFAQAVQNGDVTGGRTVQVNGIIDTVKDLALLYARQGQSASEAAETAASQIINDRFTVQDTYYVPKHDPEGRLYSLSSIDGFLRRQQTDEKLKGFDPVPFGGGRAFTPVPKSFSPQERSLIEYHRNNLVNNPLHNPDGTTTTIYITGVRGPDGREYNIPGYFDGKIQTPEAAARHAAQIGWDKFPSYATPQEADAAAKRLHKIIEADGTSDRSDINRDRTLSTAVNSGFWVTNENGTGAFLMVPFRGGGALPIVDANGRRYEFTFREASDAAVPNMDVPPAPELQEPVGG